MQLAADVPLALDEAPAFALSRDGRTLAFVGGSGQARQLYVRPIDSLSTTPIGGTDGASSPAPSFRLMVNGSGSSPTTR
jgi:hypothetical protein